MLPFICIFFDFFLHCLTVFQVQVFYHLGKIYARSVIWPGQVAARTPLTWATPVTDSKPGAPMPSPKADTQRGWSVSATRSGLLRKVRLPLWSGHFEHVQRVREGQCLGVN